MNEKKIYNKRYICITGPLLQSEKTMKYLAIFFKLIIKVSNKIENITTKSYCITVMSVVSLQRTI